LLKTTIPIDGDLNTPFHDRRLGSDTNENYWSAELKRVFAEAGITSVKTDIRDREPHSHMLRDTFAVGQLTTQYKLDKVNFKTIADALGDTVAIFLKHYAPQIKKLDDAHKSAQDSIVEDQAAEVARKNAGQGKVVNIGRGK
jgi:integrase